MAKTNKIRPKCSIEGCDKPNHCKTYCNTHFMNWKRNGDPVFINPKCNRQPGHEWTKERAYANTAKWKRENKKEYNAYLQSVKKRSKQATPLWADKSAEVEFIKNCPAGHHVDHIIPLNNKIVSGLNVIWNLQYLPKTDNLVKSNKFDGTYTNEGWRTKYDEAA